MKISANKKGVTPNSKIGLSQPISDPSHKIPKIYIVETEKINLIKIDDNYLIIFLKLIISVTTIYLLGILWLGTLIGWDKPIIELGVMPFLFAEITKILLLTALSKKILKLRKFI